MKHRKLPILFSLIILFFNVSNQSAQVKKVEMHIAGYLCGN